MERRVSDPQNREREPEYTEAEDLTTVADFFAIESDSEQMQKLTSLDSDTLKGIFDGTIQESGRREHSALLATLARTSREALDGLTREPLNNEGMRRWLEEGEFRTSQGLKKPIDALSDPRLALEALGEVQEALYG